MTPIGPLCVSFGHQSLIRCRRGEDTPVMKFTSKYLHIQTNINCYTIITSLGKLIINNRNKLHRVARDKLTNEHPLKPGGHAVWSQTICSALMNINKPDWADLQLSLHLGYKQSGEGQVLLGWRGTAMVSMAAGGRRSSPHTGNWSVQRRIPTPTRFKHLQLFLGGTPGWGFLSSVVCVGGTIATATLTYTSAGRCRGGLTKSSLWRGVDKVEEEWITIHTQEKKGCYSRNRPPQIFRFIDQVTSNTHIWAHWRESHEITSWGFINTVHHCW